MQQPPSGNMTPASMAAAGRAAESDTSASNARWKTPSIAHQMSGAYRNIVVAEKRRRANELAAKDLNATLKQETLDALRQKAHDLQNDRWMYEDVHL